MPLGVNLRGTVLYGDDPVTKYISILFTASFAEHVNLLKVHFLGYVNLGVIVERFVSTSMNQITMCLSLC